MPNIDDILKSELPTLSEKTTMKVESNNNEIDIYSFIQKQSSSTKEQVGVTLSKEIVDKLKTVCIDNNITMSKMLEDVLSQMLGNVRINQENVRIYNEKNKAKGNRNKTKKTKK